MSERSPEISIVIPTYNERDSIAAVVRDIFAVAVRRGYSIEAVIVDDNSPDGTGREADQLAKVFPVVVVHRRGKFGLGSAVVEGFAHARGRIWGMMDGDGSHPAETLPDLIEPIRQGQCQIVLGSRYARGGAVEYWPWHRWLLSRAATWIGRLFARVQDPLSGFLFFERSVVADIPLTVRGYKIGLEILVKGRYESLIEVPYTFRNREVGRSKLGWAEYLNYLQSVVQLARHVARHRDEWRERRFAKTYETGGAPVEPATVKTRNWIACPLCGSDKSRFLFFQSTYRHVRCNGCGLIFVNPMPSSDELATIYDNPLYFANRNEWTYGYNDYFGERDFYVALFARRVRQCERALELASGSGRRLLDVGCAAGFFLEVAARRGWEVAGVEVSRHAAEFANDRLGNVVRIGTLEQARFENDSFGAVVMLDVVEHVADPVGLLREAARILKPGGVLLLSAPNARGALARLIGRRWFHYKRDHVVLFSAPTLLRALDAAGLDCFHLQRNGKVVSLNYLFARLKVYVPALGRLLLATLGRLRFCDRLFYGTMTGESLAFCRKPVAGAGIVAATEAVAALPTADEIYSRFRARWWPPTALWRTAEYFRLRELLNTPSLRDLLRRTGCQPVASPPLILDLGCGDGFFIRQLFAQNLWERIVGTDRNLAELRAMKRVRADAQALCANATSLPFRSETFGFVLANCTLEHVEGLSAALAEISRVLKPGGQFVFTVPSEEFGNLLFVSNLFVRIGLRRAARAYAALVNRILGHRNILAPTQWRELLDAAGLRVERADYFMPAPLARAWDLRLWWGMPEFVTRRLVGRRDYPRPRWRALPPSFKANLTDPCASGAGVLYCCAKEGTTNGFSEEVSCRGAALRKR